MPIENRPAPAVGQVWRGTQNFLICEQQGLQDSPFYIVYESGEVVRDFDTPSHCVGSHDTYVGQFRGFKVEGME